MKQIASGNRFNECRSFRNINLVSRHTYLRGYAHMMKQFARPLLATFLAWILLIGKASPAFAQNPPQQNPGTPAQTTVGTGPVPAVSLGMSKYSYTRAPRAFPNLIAPYKPISIPDPGRTNYPRIGQLINANKITHRIKDDM